MKTEAEIDELVKRAVAAELDGLDFLTQFTYAQLADGYNGIGPEMLKAELRAKITKYFDVFAPAALGHDLRNELSDGTRQSFMFANYEFLVNCIKLALARYSWKSLKRYASVCAAWEAYKFVAGDVGWTAWLQAKGRHAAKMASDNSVWKIKEIK